MYRLHCDVPVIKDRPSLFKLYYLRSYITGMLIVSKSVSTNCTVQLSLQIDRGVVPCQRRTVLYIDRYARVCLVVSQ